MKAKYIFLLTLVSAVFAGCEKEKIDTYDMGESKVYFQAQTSSGVNGSEGYANQTPKFSFVDRPTEIWPDVTLSATVRLMGDVKNYDRPVKVVVDEEKSTIKEGEGFTSQLDTVVIKAGQNYVNLNIRFMRTKQLRERIDTLYLKLLPNEEFNVLEKYKASNSWGNTNAAYLDGSSWMFSLEEIYTQPNRWATVKADNYFGPWNPTKYIFINEFFGFVNEDWGWAENGKITEGRMPFYAHELQKELQKRADAGEPVIDEDGSYMQLADAYRVNYDNIVK